MKNKLIRFILFAMSLTFILNSCIDSEYHWDNLNKEGIINIPPVPMGSFAPIVIKDLGWVISTPELQTVTIQYADTLKNLFGSTSIKRFFHKYMERDVKINGDLDVYMLGKDSDFKIALSFKALDNTYKIIDEVNIEGMDKVEFGHNKLSIVIPQEDGQYMQAAEHLQIRIAFTSPRRIEISEGDSLKLSNLVIQTAGYFVDL